MVLWSSFLAEYWPTRYSAHSMSSFLPVRNDQPGLAWYLSEYCLSLAGVSWAGSTVSERKTTSFPKRPPRASWISTSCCVTGGHTLSQVQKNKLLHTTL